MQKTPFSSLHHDAVLDCVEQATGRRLLNICRPHSSYINRVYELQDVEGEYIIVKFFRPGRWTDQGLEDELRFVLECAKQEIPVIAPLPLQNSRFLGEFNGIRFVLYPRCGGRLVDEYNDEQWLELGRLLGRVHTVGAAGKAGGRNRLHPLVTSRNQADYVIARDLVPQTLKKSFTGIVDELLQEISSFFEDSEEIRIHGDCHAANIIHRPGESFYLIDFDDMVTGPPVQDIWMLLPGPLGESRLELSLFLEGYETFRVFDRGCLKLIEPLRAMRFIHYMSWCAWQFVEDGETRVDESFGSYSYWQKEISDLEDQLEVVRKG